MTGTYYVKNNYKKKKKILKLHLDKIGDITEQVVKKHITLITKLIWWLHIIFFAKQI